jgi:tetratricopeptide (TPR) repeat protein
MRGEASRTHLASELAATFHVGDLVAEGRYAEAESAAAEFGPHITNADYRVELLLSQAVLYEATGRYADALAAIEAAEAVGPEADVVDYDAPDYTPVKDDLRSALMVVSSGLSEAKASTTSVPEETALGAPYPNPFRGYAEIPFQIGENGRATVEVYDLVGRRIAVLAAGEPVSAGMRTYTLDGAGLATGVYIVRAVLHTDGGATRTFSQKVSLLR